MSEKTAGGVGNTGGRAATAAVMCAGALWGTSCLFVKRLSAGGMTSVMQASFKMMITAAFYLVLLLVTDRKKLKAAPRDLPLFAAAGILSVGVFTLLHYYTLIRGQASVSISLLYTAPAWVMLLSAALFGERITRRKLAALVLTVLGCALVAGMFGEQYRTPPLIVGLSLLAGLCYGLYSVFAKIATRRYHPLTMTFYTFLFAMLVIVPFGHVPEAVRLMAADPPLVFWCFGKSFFSTIIPYFLYTWGIRGTEAGRAAVCAALDPLVSALFGITVFHESANAAKLAGIACILVSVVLLNLKTEASAEQTEV